MKRIRVGTPIERPGPTAIEQERRRRRRREGWALVVVALGCAYWIAQLVRWALASG